MYFVSITGVLTPGSNHYEPQHKGDFGKCTSKSFGSSRNIKSETLGPGPAAYTIDERDPDKGHTFAKRLPAKWQKGKDKMNVHELSKYKVYFIQARQQY